MTIRRVVGSREPRQLRSGRRRSARTPEDDARTSTPKAAKPRRVAVGRSTSATAASIRVMPPGVEAAVADEGDQRRSESVAPSSRCRNRAPMNLGPSAVGSMSWRRA